MLIVLSVLGSGTALSFGAAAAILLANPNARMVPVNSAVGFSTIGGGGGKVIAVPAPMPMPAVDLPGVDPGAIPPEAEGAIREELERANVPGADEPLPQSGTQP